MSVQINITGSKGSVDLSDENFAASFKETLIHQVVTAYLAGGRSGTSAQKSRAQVSGGGKKPWRQKGTGRARAGTIRSPIFTGGGQTFARSTRDYSQKINRKMYRGAMRSIVSELARQERLLVVKEIAVKKPGTKEIAARLAKLNVNNGLIILAEEDNNVMLSVRNIPNIDITTVSNVDPVSLVAYEKVLITADAVKSLDEKLS
ncbi:MAG: 50S ribosomal protein L4 [Proteobacteria bacterium]|nr:50S ribosomal protein L4 [Pseudomonadota bacterium]